MKNKRYLIRYEIPMFFGEPKTIWIIAPNCVEDQEDGGEFECNTIDEACIIALEVKADSNFSGCPIRYLFPEGASDSINPRNY